MDDDEVGPENRKLIFKVVLTICLSIVVCIALMAGCVVSN